MLSTEEDLKPFDRATDKCMEMAKTHMLPLDFTFIQDLRHSALTNSVSVHIRSRSTSPDRLFLLMLILSISCRTASAVLKYMQQLTHKKFSLKIADIQNFLHSVQQPNISNSMVCYGYSKVYKSTKYTNELKSENFRIAFESLN